MKIALKLIIGASIFVMPISAEAGFQFTAPIQQSPSNNGGMMPLPPIGGQQSMPAVPAVQVEAASVPPMMNNNNYQVPSPPSASLQPIPPQMPVSPRPQPMSQSSTPSNENSLAVGFGKDLPLVTALRQVVPEGYTYVMDDEIAVGKTVSWNGGQPWPAVLDDMVGGLGLKSTVDGKIVRITNAQSAPVSAPQSSAPPVKVASAQPYAAPEIIYDAPAYTPPQMVRPVQPISSPPMTATQAPRNIVAPQQLQTNTVTLATTETKDLEKLKQSIVPEVTKGQWMAQSGSSLKTVLESWSNIEGVDLFWSADYDYMLAGDANISGNFEEATEELLKGFSDAKPKPTGRLHPNLPHGPAVLVIETKETSE